MRGSVFDDLRGLLPSNSSCYAPDLPGHGELAHEAPSVDAAARALAQLLDAHQGRVLVVGWSMGAMVAWRYVERFGDARLAGLMTIDMSPRLANDTGWRHGLIGQSAADLAETTCRLRRDWPGVAEAIASTMFSSRDGALGFSRSSALRQILANDRGRMIAAWEDLQRQDLRHVVPRLSCPVVAACGARSRVYPASAAEWLVATAPKARMHVFAQSGHSPHLEEPEEFAQTLAGFWRSL